MTVSSIANALSWQLLTEPTADRDVTGCYIGDLLSWVMARAQSGNVWLTVMGNVNAVAVASLTDCAAIVLCENATLDDEAEMRANQQGIPVYRTEHPLYETAVEVHACL